MFQGRYCDPIHQQCKTNYIAITVRLLLTRSYAHVYLAKTYIAGHSSFLHTSLRKLQWGYYCLLNSVHVQAFQDLERTQTHS